MMKEQPQNWSKLRREKKKLKKLEPFKKNTKKKKCKSNFADLSTLQFKFSGKVQCYESLRYQLPKGSLVTDHLIQLYKIRGIGKDKLISQNEQLREKLQQLIEQIEEQDNHKKSYDIIQNTPIEIAKIELRQQQADIAKMEKHIQNLNRQLNSNYDINRIESKEDEFNLLKAEYAALIEERELLTGISKKNAKANLFLKMEEAYNQKFKDLQSRVEFEKENQQSLLEKIEKQDKILRKLHKNIQYKEERIKEMEQKISERNRFPEKQFYITEVDIAILERKLEELKEQHLNLDKTYQKKMREMEQERREKQRQADIKLMTIKELEKETKLSQLKFKELALLIRHNALPPMNQDQVSKLYKDSLPKPEKKKKKKQKKKAKQ